MSLLNRVQQAGGQLDAGALYQSFGTLVRVNGMVLTVAGGQYTLGQRYQVEMQDGQWVEAEVVGFDREQAFLMPLTNASALTTGARVKPQLNATALTVSRALLGRVVDGLMQPLDGGPALTKGEHISSQLVAVNPMQKKGVTTPLDVGIKAINGLFTVGQGQRLGLFAGSGVGKSKLLGMMTRFTSADVVIVGLVGERGWEVKDFIEHSLGPDGMKKAIVVAAPADQSPLLRMRSAELAHRLAAWFRDQGLHVLLLVDSLTRYAQAQREIALSVGEPPATRGYPPSVFSKLTQLVERAGNSSDSSGSMTAIYTVLAEGDDQQDPIADAARAILDGHVVLSRELAERGHYPAIDIGASISRVMPNIVSEQQLKSCYSLKRLYSRYQQVQELIPLGAYQAGKDSELDRAVALYPKIEQFLCQGLNEQVDFSQTEQQLATLVAQHA
ncbi:FliI/YscN family ATPase [Rheinheimera pacifica]|uniref:Flagellum-specific ATP synthase n=1 Tax=Rheinheimera pacifica TaxID=173990 RepID=A0A1H6J4U3_9GAMM|nr:FliI/YscN family ATPase [Rheinheimera pacifica]SEH55251.1 flagellum-specific ATP synthase [Rheinheimera pacifica]